MSRCIGTTEPSYGEDASAVGAESRTLLAICDQTGRISRTRCFTRRLAVATAVLVFVGLGPVTVVWSAPTKTVPPKQWARSVCPALADFVDRLAATDEIVALSRSPEAAQMGLVHALDDAIASTGDVIATLRRAGTPDSRRGKATASTIAEEFRSIRGVLVDAQTLVASVSVSDSDRFLADLSDAKDAVLGSLGESYLVVVDVADDRIERSLRSDRACRPFL